MDSNVTLPRTTVALATASLTLGASDMAEAAALLRRIGTPEARAMATRLMLRRSDMLSDRTSVRDAVRTQTV